MTINATAAWLLGPLCHGSPRRNGGPPHRPLRHHPETTSSRSTSSARHLRPFPPEPSLRADRRHGRPSASTRCRAWNPTNICSYHLQEAGRDAGPGRSPMRCPPRSRRCSTRVKGARPGSPDADLRQGSFGPHLLLRSNAGIRVIEEIAKLRTNGRPLGADRPRALRRHRREDAALPPTAVQGQQASASTEAQPENNIQRIVPRGAGVDALPRRPRPAPLQLPAWNEGDGACPAPGTSSGACASSRCWAEETDLLEVPRHLRGLSGGWRAWSRSFSGGPPAPPEMEGRRKTGAAQVKGRALHEGAPCRVPPRAG